MRVLEPIWKIKTRLPAGYEAGSSILDWATTAGYRQGENPARWRGHPENLLVKRSKVRKVMVGNRFGVHCDVGVGEPDGMRARLL